MKLYLLRHCGTDCNKKHVLMGHSLDPKINRHGKLEAKIVSKKLSLINFDVVYSSDLLRARQTTKEIMRYQSCPVKYVKALRGKNMGIFEGKPRSAYDRYLRKGGGCGTNRRIPGGESHEDTFKRVTDFLKKTYKKHKEHTVLFSSHGGANREILRYIYNIPVGKNGKLIKRVPNSSLTIIQFHKDGRHRVKIESDVKYLNLTKTK